jgi:hypothetical protein
VEGEVWKKNGRSTEGLDLFTVEAVVTQARGESDGKEGEDLEMGACKV